MFDESQNFKQVNLDVARRLGDSLRQERLSSGRDITDIARNITLNKKQITGIECIEFSSFISSTYYFLAAKKYAAHLKVDFDFDGLINTEADLPPIYSDIPAQRAEQKSKKLKTGTPKKNLQIKKIITPALALSLLFIFGSKAISHQHLLANIEDQAEEQIKSEQTAIGSTKTIEPFLQTEAEPDKIPTVIVNQADDETIQLEVSDPTWIQVVYRNNEKNQKTYTAGETLSLKREELQGLVIGNAIAVRLIASNKEQDISPFITSSSNNVAKLFGEKLRSIGR